MALFSHLRKARSNKDSNVAEIELRKNTSGEGSLESGATSGGKEAVEAKRYGLWTRVGVTKESFKRTENAPHLNHSLKSRHLQMIAIGEISMPFPLILLFFLTTCYRRLYRSWSFRW